MSRMILQLRPTEGKIFKLTFMRHLKLCVKKFQEILHSSFYFIFSLVIFQIAIGDVEVNQKLATGIIFASLIFSLLLGAQSFFKEDNNSGVLAQLLLTSTMFESVIIAKAFAFIAANSLIFISILPIASIMHSLNFQTTSLIALTGFLTIFGTTFVSIFCSSIALSSKSKSLYAVVSLPLLVPILIFATSSIAESFYLWFLFSYDLTGLFLFTISTKYVIESVVE